MLILDRRRAVERIVALTVAAAPAAAVEEEAPAGQPVPGRETVAVVGRPTRAGAATRRRERRRRGARSGGASSS
ncbi:MAG: hypothetical protein WEC75_12165 [Dehalococcoidia bacterium]